MKKWFVGISVAVSSLMATSVPLHSGWNLVGAVEGITPSSISCAKAVWRYDNGNWMLYVKDDTSGDNYGFGKLEYIEKGEGFWVNADSNCDVNFLDANSAVSSNMSKVIYEGFGFSLIDKKNSESYLVSNSLGSNEVVWDNSSKSFILKAYRDDGKDSKAGLLLKKKNIQSVEATIVYTTDGNTTENRAQLNAYGFNIVQNDANTSWASVGIVVKPNSIIYWIEKDKSDGSYEDIQDGDIVTDVDTKGKELKLSIKRDGTKIILGVSGSINATKTLETAQTNATITSGFSSVEIRSRVKDYVLPEQAADSTTVELKDLKISQYAPGMDTSVATTLSFNDLYSGLLLDSDVIDGDNANYVHLNLENGSATEWEYEDGSWISSSLNLSVDGNVVTLPDGSKRSFEVFETRKVNSIDDQTFNDLYMTTVYETITQEGSEYDYDTWDWNNPSYYDPATNQQVNITDINTLVKGFTTYNNGGMWFGSEENPLFMDESGKVVTGYIDGYDDEGHPVVKKSGVEVGDWQVDSDKIVATTPQKIYTFEVINDNGVYKIKSGEKDRVGAIWVDYVFTGSDATDSKLQSLIGQ